MVAVGGAAAFLLAPQIREVSCQPLDQGAMVCGEGGRLFALWWYWPLAAATAAVFAIARRHQRGLWRLTAVGGLLAVLVVVFVLPTALSFAAHLVPPVGYPLAAAAALAGLAMSRRSALGVGAALAGVAGVLFIESRMAGTHDVWQLLLSNNLGWALASLLVGLAALLTAGAWAVSRRR